MIRHIVLFRFTGDVSNERRETFADQLRALKVSIPEVREMEVTFDIAHTPNSYDLSLYSTFDSMDDVNSYAIHPEHLKVLDEVKKLCSDVAKTDTPH